MQDVKYSKIAELDEICKFLVPIAENHMKVSVDNSTVICARYIPDISEALQKKYGVRISVEDAIGQTVQRVADLVRWQLSAKFEFDVLTIISDVTYIEQKNLRPWTHVDSLDLDSMTRLDLAVRLEKEFGILFTDEDIQHVITIVPEAQEILTVAGIIRFIADRLPEEQ